MRRFELILAGVGAGAVIWPALFGARSRRGIVLVATVGSLVTQLVVEGFRWQMVPLYVVAAGLGVGDLLSMERVMPWWRRVSRPALGLIGVGMMAVFPTILPVPELPSPSGPLAIGTMSVELAFPDRLEGYGPQPDTFPRRIMAQVWYPAESGDGITEPALWTTDVDVIGPAMSRRLGFPGFFLSHTRYTRSHSFERAAPLSGLFPLVIYSHGWTGFRTIAVNQAESLASHGYIVVAADHTYGAVSTRFGDGTIVGFDPAALPDQATVEPEAYAEAGSKLVATYTADLAGILDAIAEGDGGPFREISRHIDLGLVGIYGHSTGGGAAVRFCLSDPRCTSVLGMDAWVEPVPDGVIAVPATIPMLFMRSDGWRGTPNDGRLRGLAERSEAVTYWIGISGAGHNDFVVTPLFSPIAGRLGLKGPIPTGRIIPLIDRFLIGFFDRTLLGTGAAAIEQNPFDEVTLEVIG